MQRRDDGSYRLSPSDLVNFLGCAHSTVLDLRGFTEHLKRDDPSDGDQLLFAKGIEHETAYLQHLKQAGKSIAEIPAKAAMPERVRMTLDAMHHGADVIYQGALLVEKWGGFADFLERTDRPSQLGNFSYEAVDTKLAREPKVKHVVQLGVYSHLLGTHQGLEPRYLHVVLGDKSRATFAVDHSAAYVRHAMARLELFVLDPPTDSYPEPCAHCETCHWNGTCSAQWEKDDHLSLVAGVRRTQRIRLERAGVRTLAELSRLAADALVPGMNPQILERLRGQAALQEHKRMTGENKYELIQAEPGRGFSRLPKPEPGDLFFDMEGDPLYPDGLEYLFGVCFQDGAGLAFRPFWAHDHDAERATFAEFMQFLSDHLTRHPSAHIYHYSHYEPNAVKRLAGRYAIAEHQLDDLLRNSKFVDLYKVVKEAVRVSEPRYSLKNIEVFYMEKREGEVATAGDSIVVYHRWRDSRDSGLLKQIADYNEVDCRSTAKLREWLLSFRPDTGEWFAGTGTSEEAEEEPPKSEGRVAREEQAADYYRRLAQAASGDDDYRIHLADLLEFHAREARPQWWEFFSRQTKQEDELIEDAECLAGLVRTRHPFPVDRSLRHTYEFPPQETKLTAGDPVVNVATLESAGTIEEIDDKKLLVKILCGKNRQLPDSLTIGPGGPIRSDVLREAVYRFATSVLEGEADYPALRGLLSRSAPRIRGRQPGESIASGTDLVAVTIDAVTAMEESYLFIQGPPGAGKTYTSAQVIIELIRRGKKVGVAANSHKAIHNLLDAIENAAESAKVRFRGIKKSSANNAESIYNGKLIRSAESIDDISLTAPLLAGSAWLFANERFNQHLDYLFIDEAGQVSTANVIAMGTSARNLVLVGDQMQLGQPIQGVHPGKSGLSVLDFLLGSQATVSPDRGIFLSRTRRLHPSVCTFISQTFYDGRLQPDPEAEYRRVVLGSPIQGITAEGIHFIPVNHSGCSQKCEEEANVLKDYYQKLLGQQFVDKDGSTRAMTAEDLLVVSPYNIQVNHLRSVLPANARVGTVDKFQGQEAPVVLVSMATSDDECMPRGLEFLLSANRLNVALSRAQCLALVVASPRLLATSCRNIPQLGLVNNFCKLTSES